MGTHGNQSLRVGYSLRFRALSLYSFIGSTLWIVFFVLEVFPRAMQASVGPCRFSNDQLRQNSIVLFAYFASFAVVRACIFFPGIAARVAEIQTGSQGVWRMYALHMILHGPLYIFGIGSVLFGFQLFMSPKCEEDHETPDLHETLRWFAIFSYAVFFVCIVMAFFHSRLINSAAIYVEEEKRRAPKGTLAKLLTYKFIDNRELFGDHEGAKYPGECPICLSEWDQDDVVKITPCEHAFHEECIGNWLKSERTCAFCRQDVIDCRGRSSSSLSPRSPRTGSTRSPASGGSRSLPTPNTTPSEAPEDATRARIEAVVRNLFPPAAPAPQVIGIHSLGEALPDLGLVHQTVSSTQPVAMTEQPEI
jgi:hypothetical protein